MAERYADQQAGDDELSAAYKEHCLAPTDIGYPYGIADDCAMSAVEAACELHKGDQGWIAADCASRKASETVASKNTDAPDWLLDVDQMTKEQAAQALLLRDIIGNPFRRINVDRRWQTSRVIELARAIYDERAFERLPALAAALVDAGCDHAEALEHCRTPQKHARGCWVIDMLLGKL